MKPPFTINYDADGEVLYIHGSDNRPALATEHNGVVFRWALDNDELVGITVTNPDAIRKP